MGFRCAYRDITKEKVDVIVNSLGINTERYGGVCQSIVNAAHKNKELVNFIASKNGVAKIGDMFLTEGFSLPTKHILHVIMPIFDLDKEMVIYERTIRDILVFCRKNGFKKVSIPNLGTVGNHYNPILAQNILMEMCSRFVEIFTEMDITIVKKPSCVEDVSLFRNNIRDEEMLGIHRDMERFESAMKAYHLGKDIPLVREERDYDLEFFSENGPILPMGWVKKAPYISHKTVILSDSELKRIKDPDDYLCAYSLKRYGVKKDEKTKHRINLFLGNGNVSQGSKYYNDWAVGGVKNNLNRKKMFKLVLATQMNREEAVQFLSFFGIDPYGHYYPMDRCVMYCVENGIFDLESINHQLEKDGLGTLYE